MQLYITEISPKDLKRPLSSSTALWQSFGAAVTFIAGSFLTYSTVAYFPLFLNFVASIAFLTFMPETPTWLLMEGKEVKATKNLIWLRKTDDVSKELEEIKENASKAESGDKTQTLDILLKPSTIKTLAKMLIAITLCTISGARTIVGFAVNIMDSLGFNNNAYIPSAVLMIIRMVAGFVGSTLLHWTTKSKLLVVSSIGLGFTFSIIGMMLIWKKEIVASISGLEYIFLCLVLLAIFLHSIGTGMVPFVLLGEQCPPEASTKANPIAPANKHCKNVTRLGILL